MNSDPAIIKPLQFDTLIATAPADTENTSQGVTCISCRRTMLDEYFDVDGQATCPSCQQQIAQLAQTPREWGVFARACLYGFGAAILGAIVYYAVIAITNFEIGIVAIAIGFMVGHGIRMATKGRGGRRFQVVAMVLTYWAVGLAYLPFVFADNSQPDTTQAAGTNPGAPAAAPDSPTAADAVAPPASPDAAEATDAAGPVNNVPLALAVLVGLSFALPVLSVVSSMPGGIISAAIIAFGMHQAWKMTAAPQPQITGPFRIGAGPPALT